MLRMVKDPKPIPGTLYKWEYINDEMQVDYNAAYTYTVIYTKEQFKEVQPACFGK